MKAQVYNLKGEIIKKIFLDDKLFNVSFNPDLILQTLHVYRSNERAGTAHTKTRGKVKGGGKKPWPQKHTGRARASSIRSPLWRGGGTVFGPRKDKNYAKKLNKKVKKKATAMILSKKITNKQLLILDSTSFNNISKAKEARLFLESLQNFFKSDKYPSYLFILGNDKIKNLKKAFSNFKNTQVSNSKNINAYKLLKKKYVIIEEPMVETLTKLYGKQ